MEHAGFPSEETLAEFIDGRLDDEARKRVIEHIAECEECWSAYMAANEMNPEILQATPATIPSAQPGSRVVEGGWGARKWWLSAAAGMGVAALLTLVFLTGRLRHQDEQPKSLLARLNAAAPPNRNIEGRLSGFDYRPIARTMRGDETDPTKHPENARLFSVVADVSDEANRNPSPENLHALGVSYVILGNWDEAVSKLEDAVKTGAGKAELSEAIRVSRDVTLLSDLAAAYGGRGRHLNRPDDFVRMLNAANRAWQLAHRPETAWNRAVALESMHMDEDSKRAWIDYRAVESAPGWLGELRQRSGRPTATRTQIWNQVIPILHEHLRRGDEAAVAEIASRFAEETRLLAETDLIPNAVSSHDSLLIGEARRLAGIVARQTGDDFDSDVLEAAAECEPSLIASAYTSLHEGRELMSSEATSKGMISLQKAEGLFERCASPLALTARIAQASCAYLRGDSAQALLTITSLRRSSGLKKTYVEVAAQIDWVSGLCLMRMSRPVEAERYYQHAAAAFGRLGERSNEARMHAYSAQAAAYYGDGTSSWQQRLTALRMISADEGSDNAYHIFIETAIAAADEDCPYAALSILDRVLSTRGGAAPSQYCAALIWRARLHNRIGDQRQASADFAAAYGAAVKIGSSTLREQLETEAGAFSDALPAGDANRQVERLSLALQRAQSLQTPFRIAEILLARGATYLKLGDTRAAFGDFEAGLREIAAERKSSDDPSLRRRVRKQLEESALRVLLETRQPERAEQLLETVRSDEFRSRAARLSSSALQSHAYPDSVTVVSYGITPSTLAVWLRTAKGLHWRTIPLSSGRIASLATKVYDDRTGQSSLNVLGELYDLLVRPIRDWLPEQNTIVFITGEELGHIPFTALYDRSTRRFLVEDYATLTAPTESLFLASLAHDEGLARAGRPVAALIVGVSTPNRSVFPMLERLESARAEVDAIAAEYPDAQVLREGAATKDEILRRIPLVSIFHFVGHSIGSAQHLGMAGLVASPRTSEDTGVVYANEIASVISHGTPRLIVLAACGTARRTGDAPITFAQALLASGAPTIVATLSPIDDALSVPLYEHFHRAIAAGESPAAALRTAQLAILSSNTSARVSPYWSAATIIGGGIYAVR
jgi:CHAT domain-containing protein